MLPCSLLDTSAFIAFLKCISCCNVWAVHINKWGTGARSPEGTLSSPPSFRLAKMLQSAIHSGRWNKPIVWLVEKGNLHACNWVLLTPHAQMPLFFQDRLLGGKLGLFFLHQECHACKDCSVICLHVLWVHVWSIALKRGSSGCSVSGRCGRFPSPAVPRQLSHHL